MSGRLGGSAGYGIAESNLPTLEEATAQAVAAFGAAGAAMANFTSETGNAEVAAFRAQRFSDLAGELAAASYVLQRAAYDKATK